MNLDRVTITGADDSIPPEDLAPLSEEFPFVEWGILVSRSSEGRPRFPGRNWIWRAAAVLPGRVALSLHVCGKWVREWMVGKDHLSDELCDIWRFQRVQLNFHAQHHEVVIDQAAGLLGEILGGRQAIVQMDSTDNEALLAALRFRGLDCVPLFDVSGGAGIVPARWTRPIAGVPYHGYAGGLGPENLAAELSRISDAAGDARVWIDMETRVRTEDDARFDLEKVRRCLEIASGWVRP